MTAFFIIMLAIAIGHFVWDGIIAPSSRLRLRFEVFEQRDRLRQLCEAHPRKMDRQTFSQLNDELNNAIQLLPHMTISTLVTAYTTLERDPRLRTRIEKRRRMVEECDLQEIHLIDKAVLASLRKALGCNSFGWAIYLVPVALAYLLLRKINDFISELVALPRYVVQRLLAVESPDSLDYSVNVV